MQRVRYKILRKNVMMTVSAKNAATVKKAVGAKKTVTVTVMTKKAVGAQESVEVI